MGLLPVIGGSKSSLYLVVGKKKDKISKKVPVARGSVEGDRKLCFVG